ncbi:MAG: hypothetical protein MI700_04650, partial [Balneolales bacterium]|nr:hypothetical protein [Balneolales bacterium]
NNPIEIQGIGFHNEIGDKFKAFGSKTMFVEIGGIYMVNKFSAFINTCRSGIEREDCGIRKCTPLIDFQVKPVIFGFNGRH